MIRPAHKTSIIQAGEQLRKGKLVTFPTETVYGLGADATSDKAVARIFQAKERPSFNPLIIHIPALPLAEEIVEFTETARHLADVFWPGPLTLVMKRNPSSRISLLATAGLETIALRIPAQATAQAILNSAGVPIAAPSANPSGKISPTRAEHVLNSLGDRAGLIIDDGPCNVGLESTVLDCSGLKPNFLRVGGTTIEQIEAAIGSVNINTHSTDTPSAPGMLRSHYAPRAKLRLDVSDVQDHESLLSFGQHKIKNITREKNLSPSADLEEAAANLFSMIRMLDQSSNHVAVMPIPDSGIGRAINDRLRRAAAPDIAP